MLRIGKGFGRWTLRTRFIVVLLLLGVVPMTIIGTTVYQVSRNIIITQATRIQSQSLEQEIAQIDRKLLAFQQLAGALIREEGMARMLDPDSSPDDIRRYLGEWTEFNSMLNKNVFVEFKSTPLVTVYGYNGKAFVNWETGGGESLKSYLNRSAAFQAVANADPSRDFYWSFSHPDFTFASNGEAMISYVANYYLQGTDTLLGQIVISAPDSAFFTDPGIYLIHAGSVRSLGGGTVASLPRDVEDAALAAGQGGESEVIHPSGGSNDTVYLAGRLLSDTVYIKPVPYRSMLSGLEKVYRLMLLVTAAGAVLSILLGHLFIGRIVKPVKQLVKMMKQVGNGEWRGDEEIRADPELRLLQTAFRRMTDDLEGLKTQIQEEQREKLELEFQALLSQIHPHMIKNTLASIEGLALMGETEQIRSAIHSLGYFLSSRIYADQPLIALEEELTALEHYVRIMQIRYPERFQVIVDIPPSLRKQAVPRFLLQPLVENSIYHGMDANRPLLVWVQAYDSDGAIVMEVTDNGKGGSVRPLDDAPAERTGSSFSGLGLVNIRKRIRLHFGEAFGLSFDSEPGRGSRVRITLPDRPL
ncbi:sensor histidine kinase [Cohnella thailandensis]|uniref:histidine kinase n=1 Tax=Cohnella thailandensis TaxID=557557 RepID=A0A841T3H4_9BACL|nr:sensor histidine kinase [Cohnella thailandensis]MBB6637406.1 sensor histidine kinase [Cohnella thailandensis]MBP1976735.1 signal transduction histidine kinase [Cohnella thailandensis]